MTSPISVALAQDRLLKLARDRTLERPDGGLVPVDVRVIAATTRDLKQEVAADGVGEISGSIWGP